MAKVLAITNQKGGVGKTTSTVNIGAGLARRGNRVVLVDLDPQINLTRGLNLDYTDNNVYGALLGEYLFRAQPVQKNLAVIPGSPALSSFDKVKGDELDREFLLKDILRPILDKCDYVLLDCPPALGLITLNAYACADSLLVPLEAQLYATEGLDKVMELLSRVQRRLNPGLKVEGIFFTRFDGRKVLRRETAELVREKHPGLVLQSTVRETIGLGEAPHVGQDIFSYAPASAGAADYQKLVDELLAR